MFSLLAGQFSMALLQRLPWNDRAWLLLLPLLPFVRRWNWLGFAGGILWQRLWQTNANTLCHPFFWFLCSAEPGADPVPLGLQDSRWDRWADGWAQSLLAFFMHWDSQWGSWYLRFAFGLQEQAGEGWADLYQELGLLHVLVVSGAHFSFLGGLGRLLLEGPGRIAYALRLLSFPLWLGWTTFARLLLTILLTLFALIVGFHPPCQRSWLSLLLQLWLPLIAAKATEQQHDRWVFYLQALCFPNSFLSLSNALSWSAYTLVRYLRPWPQRWQRRLLPTVEGPLIAVNLSYFGYFSPWGIVLNTLLQPFWHLVLVVGLLFLITPQAWIGDGLRILLQRIHELILLVYERGQTSGPTYVMTSPVWRCALWCAGGWAFLSVWQRREDAC